MNSENIFVFQVLLPGFQEKRDTKMQNEIIANFLLMSTIRIEHTNGDSLNGDCFFLYSRSQLFFLLLMSLLPDAMSNEQK